MRGVLLTRIPVATIVKAFSTVTLYSVGIPY